MKNRTAVLLAIGVGSTGLLIGLSLSRSNAVGAAEQARAAELAAVTAARSQETARRPDLPDLERPGSRVPALTERPAPSEPAPVTPTSVQAKPATIDPSDPRALPESTLDEMTKKRAAIERVIQEKSQPIIRQRIQDGLVERTSDDPDSEAERALIQGFSFVPGRDPSRTVLQRWQYPDLYELKDQTLRLDKLIKDANGQAAQPSVIMFR